MTGDRGRKLSTDSPTVLAIAALRAAGWPDQVDGIDPLEIRAGLVHQHGLSEDDASQAFHEALAQLMAERFRSSTYIDVDLCTAHLLVVRQRDQVRHFSIDYVLNTLAAVHGPAFTPDDNNNNLH